MIVDKNRLLRNKAKKILKEKGELFGSDDMPAIQKMDIDIPQGEYHYRRRLNQNIKDRVNSMCRDLTLNMNEVADLLDLIQERLKLDGHSLEEVEPYRVALHAKYGGYSKKFTTNYLFETDADIMVEISHNGHKITDGANKRLAERVINEEGR